MPLAPDWAAATRNPWSWNLLSGGDRGHCSQQPSWIRLQRDGCRRGASSPDTTAAAPARVCFLSWPPPTCPRAACPLAARPPTRARPGGDGLLRRTPATPRRSCSRGSATLERQASCIMRLGFWRVHRRQDKSAALSTLITSIQSRDPSKGLCRITHSHPSRTARAWRRDASD